MRWHRLSHPKSYIRKLTLAPAVTAYQHLKKGETILLTWQITEGEAKDYSDFVRHTWEYCYDTYLPKPVDLSLIHIFFRLWKFFGK